MIEPRCHHFAQTDRKEFSADFAGACFGTNDFYLVVRTERDDPNLLQIRQVEK